MVLCVMFRSFRSRSSCRRSVSSLDVIFARGDHSNTSIRKFATRAVYFRGDHSNKLIGKFAARTINLGTTATATATASATAIPVSSNIGLLGNHPYGLREYFLMPVSDDDAGDGCNFVKKDEKHFRERSIGSLRASGSVIFGARINKRLLTLSPSTTEEIPSLNAKNHLLALLDAALEDAVINGEQPQALGTLNGLCDWVTRSIESSRMKGDDNNRSVDDNQHQHYSHVIQNLRDTDSFSYEAICAIATGIPRKGHSVVGAGTYRDGKIGWAALAKEYVERGFSNEAELYKSRGAQLVEIEHLAETQNAYLKTAGGAMSRFFFL